MSLEGGYRRERSRAPPSGGWEERGLGEPEGQAEGRGLLGVGGAGGPGAPGARGLVHHGVEARGHVAPRDLPPQVEEEEGGPPPAEVRQHEGDLARRPEEVLGAAGHRPVPRPDGGEEAPALGTLAEGLAEGGLLLRKHVVEGEPPPGGVPLEVPELDLRRGGAVRGDVRGDLDVAIEGHRLPSGRLRGPRPLFGGSGQGRLPSDCIRPSAAGQSRVRPRASAQYPGGWTGEDLGSRSGFSGLGSRSGRGGVGRPAGADQPPHRLGREEKALALQEVGDLAAGEAALPEHGDLVEDGLLPPHRGGLAVIRPGRGVAERPGGAPEVSGGPGGGRERAGPIRLDAGHRAEDGEYPVGQVSLRDLPRRVEDDEGGLPPPEALQGREHLLRRAEHVLEPAGDHHVPLLQDGEQVLALGADLEALVAGGLPLREHLADAPAPPHGVADDGPDLLFRRVMLPARAPGGYLDVSVDRHPLPPLVFFAAADSLFPGEAAFRAALCYPKVTRGEGTEQSRDLLNCGWRMPGEAGGPRQEAEHPVRFPGAPVFPHARPGARRLPEESPAGIPGFPSEDRPGGACYYSVRYSLTGHFAGTGKR